MFKTIRYIKWMTWVLLVLVVAGIIVAIVGLSLNMMLVFGIGVIVTLFFHAIITSAQVLKWLIAKDMLKHKFTLHRNN